VKGETPKESAHEQRRALLTESVDEADSRVSGLKKQLERAEPAIAVRLDAQLHLCEERITNIKLMPTISLLPRNGGLDSGPAFGEVGSFESTSASCTSHRRRAHLLPCRCSRYMVRSHMEGNPRVRYCRG
jgi:hypothetical protein